jgi:hypothetical protein
MALVGETVPVRYERLDLLLRLRGTARRWSALVGFYAGYRVILGHTGLLEYVTATFKTIVMTGQVSCLDWL